MNNKVILIIGGSGFIGSNLVKNLLPHNKIYILDKVLPEKKKIAHINIKYLKSDIKNIKNYENILKKTDYLFHLAGFIGKDLFLKKEQLVNNDIVNLMNLTSLLKINQKIKIIFTSSCQIYGNQKGISIMNEDKLPNPETSYGISKLIAEIYLKDISKRLNIPIACLRLFNVYGLGQSTEMAIPNFINKAKNNVEIKIDGDGTQTRDFLHIDDCIKAMVKVAKKIKKYEIINIPGSTVISINNLVKLIIKITGSRSKINYLKNNSKMQIKKSIGSSVKLNQFINYKPDKRLNDGIKEILSSYE